MNKVPFNFEAMKSFYIERKILSENEFGDLVKNTIAIRNLQIEGFNWLPIDQAASQFRDQPISLHYEAMSCATNIPFTGIEEFYKENIKREYLPPWYLNRTNFYEDPVSLQGMRIGRLLIRLGLISENTLQRALGIQSIIENEVGTRPFLALIFNKTASLSAHDFYQALAIQIGMEYVSLDRSVDDIVTKLRQR